MFQTALFGGFGLLCDFGNCFFGSGFGSFQSSFFRLLGGFEFGQTGFQFGQLGTSFNQNLLLDVEFLSGYQIHAVERAAEHGFNVFFHVFGRAVGDGFADFGADFFKKLFAEHNLYPS